jgi:hypothetical protein
VLDPSARSLYTSSLAPPPGYAFDQGLATTFSLDLTTLLTVPLHLLMLSTEWDKSGLPDPIAVLEGLRRVTSRMSVYCQSGRIAPPASQHVLYGLLESVVIQVRAPKVNGVFHPKLWVLRYLNNENGSVLIRVIVLSRNLTVDDSWDTVLAVEGTPGAVQIAENQELSRLVSALPTPRLALQTVPDIAKSRAKLLAREIERCRWELPRGFNSLVFTCLGLSEGSWLPPQSSRLAVITPFCGAQAINQVVKTSGRAVALISRPEELAGLPQQVLSQFERVLVINQAAEAEWGTDQPPGAGGHLGLHAKVYVTQQGSDVTVAVGSANMTEAGLFGTNVELVAQLAGKRGAVGGVDDLLASEGLGGVLTEYEPSQPDMPSDSEIAAEKALEAARRTLATTELTLRCEASGDQWRLVLRAESPPALDGIERLHIWPVSWDESRAVDALALAHGEPIDLGCCALVSITGFLVFSLTALDFPSSIDFVLNVPLQGLPEGRDAAMTRLLVDNQGAFLRYVRLLLALDLDSGFTAGGDGGSSWSFGDWSGLDELSLLEDLAKSLGRDTARLKEVDRLVRELTTGPETSDVVPGEFLTMWRAFQPLLEES